MRNSSFENQENFCILKSFSSTGRNNKRMMHLAINWEAYEESSEKEVWYQMQKIGIALYGFDSEDEFANFLRSKKIILMRVVGLGYKAAWFASLAPESLVIGIDYSEALQLLHKLLSLSNLLFAQGDIATTPFTEEVLIMLVADQVIMHTKS